VVEVVAEDAPAGLRDIPLVVADLVDSHEEFREVDITGEVQDVGMADMLEADTIMEDIITVAMADTFIEGMHRQVPYLELFSVE
jgi:hypothetical protein